MDLPDGTGAYEVIHDAPPAPLPDWLTGLLTPAPHKPLPLSAHSGEGVADLDAYTRQALKGEAARVTSAETGGRNWALNKDAMGLRPVRR